MVKSYWMTGQWVLEISTGVFILYPNVDRGQFKKTKS